MQVVTAHGASIPTIGFGTFQLDGEACASSVAEAIRVGYRHIDTAAVYGNEERVGEGIRAAAVARDALFITTKVRPRNLAEKPLRASVEQSLRQIGVDQVDLVLIHWASKTLSVAETIQSLNAAKRDGLTRHIGVSNFTTRLLAEAWAATGEPLVTNQCEFHPYLNQDKLRAACAERGMCFTAYSPLGQQIVLGDAVIGDIAKHRERTPAAIVLRWHIQHDGVVTIPKSATPDRIRSNFDIFDFSLSDAEMAAISALSKTYKRRVADPAGVAPVWDD